MRSISRTVIPIVDGTVSVTADDDFQGAGLTLEQCVYAVGDVSGYGPGTQVILIGGYRFYGYDSRLAIADQYHDLSGAGAGLDQTRARRLHDRQRISRRRVRRAGAVHAARPVGSTAWSRSRSADIARTVTINGETVTIPDGMPAEICRRRLAHLRARPTSATYSDSRVRLIPEFRIGVGVYLTPQWTAPGRLQRDRVERRRAGRRTDCRRIWPSIRGIFRRGSRGGGVSPLFSGHRRLGTRRHTASTLGVEYTY